MFYLVFSVFSLGAAMLQSAYLRAPKGIVPTRRRRIYTAVAAAATLIQVLAALMHPVAPAYIAGFLFVPIFYVVNRGLQLISLRLRYTFRIGLALVLVSAYPMIHPLISDTVSALGI